MTFDPLKSGLATKAPDSEFDPLGSGLAVRDTAKKEESNRLLLPSFKDKQAATDLLADPEAVAASDWIAKNHGLDAAEVDADYEGSAKAVGLSGNPSADFTEIKHRQSELDARKNTIIPVHRDPNAFNRLGEQFGYEGRKAKDYAVNVAKDAPAALAKSGYDLAAGTVDLGSMATVGLFDRILGRDLIAKMKEADPEFQTATDIIEAGSATLRDLADYSSKAYGVDEDFEETITGQLMGGGSTVVTGIATLGYGIAGQLYTEAIRDTEAATGMKYADLSQHEKDLAALKGVAYVGVGSVLERTGLKYLGGGQLKGFLAGKVSLPKGKIAQMLSAASVEGGTEALQGQLMDSLAVAVEGDERELVSFDVLKQRAAEFALGFTVGGGANLSMQGLQIASSRMPGAQRAEVGAAMDRQMPFNDDGSYNPEYRPMPIFDADGQADGEILNLMRDYQKVKAEDEEAKAKPEPEGGKSEEEQADDAAREEKLKGMEAQFSDLIDERLESYGMDSGLSADARAIRVFNTKLIMGLDPMSGATAMDWRFIDENYSDKETTDHVLQATNDPELVPVALAAKHGDAEAQKEYVEKTAVDMDSDPTARLTPEARESLESDPFDVEADINEFIRQQSEGKAPEGGAPKTVADMIEFVQSRQLSGSTLEYEDRVYSLQDELNAMLESGVMPEEVEQFAFDRMTAAGQNAGEDYIAKGVQPSGMSIAGSNIAEFKRDVFRDVSRIYRGADALDVIEESVEGFAKRMVAEGVHTYEDYRGWKKDVEQNTGVTTHGNSKTELIEWLSEQGKAWITGQSRALTEADALPLSFRAWLAEKVEYFKHVLRHAARLKKLKRDGLLGDDFETFLERSLGLDEAYLEQRYNQEMEAAALEQEFDEKDELVAVIRRIGGLPTPDADPAHRGELENVRENFGKRWPSMSNSKGSDVDTVRRALNADEGFNFDTPSDLFDALDAAARGEKIYPMQDARSAAERGATLSMKPLIESASRFGAVGFQGKKPKKLYRGVKDSGEPGAASYGVGTYTTTSKAQAKEYGRVVEMNPDTDLPLNPVYFDSINDFETWQSSFAFDKLGLRRMSELADKIGSFNELFKSLGADGVQIGKGAGAFFVKYPTKGATFSMKPMDAPFYSQLERTLEAKIQGKAATVQQIKGLLDPKHGIKPEEVKWSGIEQWLDDNADAKGKVSTAELLAYLRDAGRVRFEEVTRGDYATETSALYRELESKNNGKDFDDWNESDQDQWMSERGDPAETQYSSYVLPGGENYREVVLTMPEVKTKKPYEKWLTENFTGEDNAMARELYAIQQEPDQNFKSSHFTDIPNYVAHMRLNERDGGLFIEEIQSDRHQQGREKGYKGELPKGWTFEEGGDGSALFKVRDETGKMQGYGDSKAEALENIGSIADAPFRKDWHLQMFKRALRDAVASGKTWIGWTTGETQAERFDLSKQVNGITVYKARGGYKVEARDSGDEVVIDEYAEDDSALAGLIGKDLARSMVEEMDRDGYPQATRVGDDLKVGGEGMKGFYDKMLPAAVQKYVKKWGAKVETVNLDAGATFISFEEFLAADGLSMETISERVLSTRKKAYAEEKAKYSSPESPPIHKVEITDAMRESVQAGQATFSMRPMDTPAFKKWFGDSKVVDENGDPLVVYHGTHKGDFDRFDISEAQTGLITGHPIAKHGFFFAPTVSYAEVYSGKTGSIYPSYLSIKNPYRHDMFGAGDRKLENAQGIAQDDLWAAYIDDIKAKGHDGIFMMWEGAVKEYMAFNPTQIKSATGNRGTFDAADPRITHSMRPMDEKDAAESAEREADRKVLTPEELEYKQAQAAWRMSGEKRMEPKVKLKLTELRLKAVNARKLNKVRETARKQVEREITKRVDAIAMKARSQKNVVAGIAELEKLVKRLPQKLQGRFTGFLRMAKIQRGRVVGEDGKHYNINQEAAQRRFLEYAAVRIKSIFDQDSFWQKRKELSKLLEKFATQYAPTRRKQSERYTKEVRDALTVAAQFARSEDYVPLPEGMSQKQYDNIEAVFSGLLIEKVEGSGVSKAAKVSVERIQQALDASRQMMKDGRFFMDKFKAERARERESLIEGAVDSILKGDKLDTPQKARARDRERSKAVKKAISETFDFLYTAQKGFEQKMDDMDAAGSDYMNRNFYEPVLEAAEEEETLNREDLDFFANAVADSLGVEGGAKLQKRLKAMKDTVEKTGIFFAQDIEGNDRVEQPMSRMEGVSFYNALRDDTLALTWERMGVTAETAKQVAEFIGEEGVALADILFEGYRQKGIEVQGAFEASEGYKMDLVENYGGRLYRVGIDKQATDSDPAMGFDASGKPTVKTGSLKERQSSSLPLEFREADVEFVKHMTEMNHFISHAKVAKQLQGVFGKEKVRRAMIQKHGSKFSSEIIGESGHIADILRGGGQMANFQGLLGTLRGNVTRATLGLNIPSFFKQLTSFPAYAAAMPVDQFAKYQAKFWANPIDNIKSIMEMPFIRNRMAGHYSRDVNDQILRARKLGMTSIETIKDKLMIMTRFGDVGAIAAGGWGLRQYTFDQAKADGKTDAAAQREADTAFIKATVRAQQSSAIHALGSHQRGNQFMRLFTMYMTSPIQYNRNAFGAIEDAIKAVRAKGKGQITPQQAGKIYKQTAKTFVIFHILLPQIFTALSQGFVGLWSDDEEAREQFWRNQYRALLLGNLNSLFMLGGVMDYAATKLVGLNPFFGGAISNPVFQKVEDIVTDLLSDKDGKKVEALLDSAALISGVPIDPVRRTVEGMSAAVEGRTDAPVLRFLGWSEYALGLEDEDAESREKARKQRQEQRGF